MRSELRCHLLDATPDDVARLEREQLRRRDAVRCEPIVSPPNAICGLDVAYTPDGDYALAAAVLVGADGEASRIACTSLRRVSFPYIPGMFAYREAVLMADALAGLEQVCERPVELVFCDGNGTLRPRGFGAACAVGLLTDRPVVGVSKNAPVTGNVELAAGRGASVPLRCGEDSLNEGVALRTRDGVRPVFVSVGHRVTLDDAIDWTLRCSRYRIPDPIRLADRACRDRLTAVT